MPFRRRSCPVIWFRLSAVVSSLAEISLMFAIPCVTLAWLDATSWSSAVTAEHRLRELAQVRDRRVDVRAVGRTMSSHVLGDDRTFSTMCAGAPPPAARRGTSSGSADILDVDLDVARELRDLVEADRHVALESRALGQPGAPTGPGTSSTYFSPRSPRFATEPDAPWRRSTSPSSSMSTIALPVGCPAGSRATLPTRHPGHAHRGLLVEPRDVLELDLTLPGGPSSEPQVLDLPDQKARQDQDDQKKRSDLRRGAHAPSEKTWKPSE